MKIAIINKFFFLKGGQETVALEQMRLLKQMGHEVAFFSMHHPHNPKGYEWSNYFVDYADFSHQQPTANPLQTLSLGMRFISNKQAAKRFRAFIKKFNPDIIHCHGIAHQLTYSILPVAKHYRIPIVQTLHDYQIICPSYTLLQGDNSLCQSECNTNNYLPCIKNRCVKGSLPASVLSALEMSYNRSIQDYTKHIDKFISPSRFLAQKVIEAGINQQKIINIPNFLVNIDDIVPNYENQGYFMYIGRLSYEKGILTLIDAFQSNPNAKLYIAGDGPQKNKIIHHCQANHIKNVELLGHLDRHKIAELLSDAMAVILPSEWYENQPMTIIEAFAYGKPVIASNIGGIPEMVIDGVNGYLFPPGDSEALASIIRRTLNQKENLKILGKKARSMAIEHYNATQHLEELTNLYEALL